MTAIKVTIDKTKKIAIIEVPLQTPKESGSGKSTVLASTHGNVQTADTYEGRPIYVGANVYVKIDK